VSKGTRKLNELAHGGVVQGIEAAAGTWLAKERVQLRIGREKVATQPADVEFTIHDGLSTGWRTLQPE
jgi:hypothetical protein